MHRRNRLPLLALLIACVILVPAVTRASGAPSPFAEDDALRPMELPDILAWKSIRGRELSDDGRWLAYRVQPNEGDSEVVVRSVDDTTEYRFPIGEQPPFGGGSTGGRGSDRGTVSP